jgi:hypothetical protein
VLEAGETLAAGGDGADDDALPDLISRHARSQLLDHADRLVADDAAALDRVLALEDVDIGAADGRGGDPDQRVARPDLGHRLVVEDDATRLDEHGRLHPAHDRSSIMPCQWTRRSNSFTFLGGMQADPGQRGLV